ncbi:methionine aminopeptidase 1D, mitochondrial isoform X2 [Chrysoperla carnea]|uniref:methionine aminopeptidase 1D, mitochondrial isoform X2 n=1 Tax=Chrysoperla carnea TaxID=189513 RepID=UPI001D0888E9|nr:methionine aminopeptidase 1D, mitochondrial isoform X2 [Chrysoperla carnea]
MLLHSFSKNLNFRDFGKYSIVMPGQVSPMRSVPEHIEKPDYYKTGEPKPATRDIEIKNSKQIQLLKDSCKLAANILEESGKILKVGMTTDELDNIIHQMIVKRGAYPSPLNYHHFPKSVCTSINNVACHGIPDDRKLQDGDIINVDITVFLNGYHGDCSKTYLVGNVDQKGRELVKATENCLKAGINVCKPGVDFCKIGEVIEKRAHEQGFGVVPAFCGHGIGSYFHGPPEIIHMENAYPYQMEPGMTFTIEPVLGQGSRDVELLEDGWTCITTDGSRTAQFEHTVLITDNGVEILTLPDEK